MKASSVVSCALAIACTGCANFMTVDRTTSFPEQKNEDKASGVAIHLDAPQRLVFSGPKGDICAEPSPDALQAYAASLGASFSSPGKESAALAGALSGSVAGLGLRTQAITLMRDHLYRICEARHNGALSNPDVMQLLERSQDLTLGILAIEQLTGAVVARQPILTMGANADASANANNTQKALDAAKKDEAEKKAALPALKDTEKKAQAAVDEALKQETEAKAKAAGAIALIEKLTPELTKEQTILDMKFAELIEAKKPLALKQARIDELNKKLEQAMSEKKSDAEIKTIQDEINKEQGALGPLDNKVKTALQEQEAQKGKVNEYANAIQAQKNKDEYRAYAATTKDVKEKQDTLKNAKDAITSTQEAFEQSQKVVQAIQSNLNAALSSGQAAAKGEGAFAQGADRNNLSKETVAQLASTTEKIVSTVVNKGHLTDTCANLITSRLSNTVDEPTKALFIDLLPLCKSVFEANIKAYLERASKDTGSGPITLSVPLLH